MTAEPGRANDHQPGRERVERIVRRANRAPSGDNCQPWRFRWDGAELSVIHDAERARHRINHAERGSHLTLGCVLESIAVAASAEGLAAGARLRLDDPEGRWATVRFAPGASAPAELAAELEARATDRRLYRGGSTSHPVFAAIRRDAADFEGCRLHVLDRLPRELVRYMLDVDGYILQHEDVFRDVLRWVRLSDEEVEATRDGVSWRTIGVELPPVPTMRLVRARWSRPLLELAGLGRAARAWLRLQLASSAAIWAITVRPGRPEDLVAAGRLGLRAWLRLCRAGFGVQPLTLQALPVYNLATGGLPPTTRPEFVELFRAGREVLARAFGWPSGELPVWMFRTGLTTPLPARLRTLRLRTEAILTVG